MKSFLLSYFFLFTTIVTATELPQVPANCFSQSSYCSSVDVVKDQAGRKVIRVKLFADLSKTTFPEVQDITQRYLDFAKWPDYAMSSNDLEFHASEERHITVNGEERIRHFVHYIAKAPWPIKTMEVIDLVEYSINTSSVQNSLFSANFAPAQGFSARKGVKHNIGELHIAQSPGGKSWRVFFITDVIPEIELLPNVAAPYIQRPIHAIFKGMFDL